MDQSGNTSSAATDPGTLATTKKQKLCYKARALMTANSFMPATV